MKGSRTNQSDELDELDDPGDLGDLDDEELLVRVYEEDARLDDMSVFELNPTSAAELGQLVELNVNRTDEEDPVVVPAEIGNHLKSHQVEAIQFMFDQTIKSVEMLTKAASAAAADISAAAADDAAAAASAGGADAEPSGCVLAHSMGLGKTLTCIAFTRALSVCAATRARMRMILVVAPTNVVNNWKNEYVKWCGARFADRKVLVVDTNVATPDRLRLLRRWQAAGGVLIVGYEMFTNLVSDRPPPGRKPAKNAKPGEAGSPRTGAASGGGVEPPAAADEPPPPVSAYTLAARKALQAPGPDLMVLDEAHLIKNRESKTYKVGRRDSVLRDVRISPVLYNGSRRSTQGR